MDTKLYQTFTKSTAIYPKDKALEYLALGLTSEAGEVAGKVKKVIRDSGGDRNALIDEIGDVFWYLSELCNYLDVSIDEVLVRNRDKLQDRMNRHALQGSGDRR